MMTKTNACAVQTLVQWLARESEASLALHPDVADAVAAKCLRTLLLDSHRSLMCGYLEEDFDRIWSAIVAARRPLPQAQDVAP
jgi:hypothetical protein